MVVLTEIFLSSAKDTYFLDVSDSFHRLTINGQSYQLVRSPKRIWPRAFQRHPAYVASQGLQAPSRMVLIPILFVDLLEGYWKSGLGNETNWSISDSADTDVGFIASTYPYNGKIRDFGLVSATVEALGDHPGGCRRVGALLGDLDEVDYYTGVFRLFRYGARHRYRTEFQRGWIGWLVVGWNNFAVVGQRGCYRK